MSKAATTQLQQLHEFAKANLWLDDNTNSLEVVDKATRLFELCVQIELDSEALTAAYLFPFTPFSASQRKAVQTKFGQAVCDAIDGVVQMENISAFSKAKQGMVSDENLRNMLIAMINDVRVVLIKLADQVDVLRHLKTASEQTKRDVAQLTLDVYARLANRLGVWYLKWEMEDYALRYLEPDDYHHIAKQLVEKRRDREQYIESFIARLEKEVTQVNLQAKVVGRPKHIYSIWRKMKSKGLSFENIFDIRAVRVLVENIGQCYTALGLVHTQWKYLPGEFDDYIATPKPNGYQSIHTAVIGPADKVIEVQIRTYDMHENNELGVAAHWRYKEKTGSNARIDDKILWLRQLLQWKQDVGGEEGVALAFDVETEQSRIYVFSPMGKVIDLPLGSTAIDFAYAIHTEVGHKTRGTRVNQKMRPLNTQLKMGDQVEIITVKTPSPSRDWITLSGYVKTNRARARISHWFKGEDKSYHISLGREKLERALNQRHFSDLSFEKISSTARYETTNDMLRDLGSGEVKISKLFRSWDKPKTDPLVDKKEAIKPERPYNAENNQFTVHGVGKLKTQIAQCCQPIPGDIVVGFITRGRGVTIHQKSCSNMRHLPEEDISRLIDVAWRLENEASFGVRIIVVAYNRNHLLNDVTNALKAENIEITKAVLDTQDDEVIVKITLELQLNNPKQVDQLIGQVKGIPNVIDVKR